MLFKKKSEFEIAWNKYKKAVDKKIPKHTCSIAKGVGNSVIEQIETKMNLKFPDEVKDFYKCCNGDSKDRLCGTGLGLHVNSIEEMYSEWGKWKSLLDSLSKEVIDSLNASQSSKQENKIKKNYINVKWIPLISDSGGNHIGIDLDPDSNGIMGQVITFGRDESEKIVIANSMVEFIVVLTRIIESKDCKIEKYEGEQIIVLNGHYHAIDYLKTLQKQILRK